MKHIRKYNEALSDPIPSLVRSEYRTWNTEFAKAFEVAKKDGTCEIPGDSYLNPFSKFKLKSDSRFIMVYDVYEYNGDFFTITPVSHDPDYGSYGNHIVKFINSDEIKSDITKLYNKIVK